MNSSDNDCCIIEFKVFVPDGVDIVHSLSTDDWTNSQIDSINKNQPRIQYFTFSSCDDGEENSIRYQAEQYYLDYLYNRYPGTRNRIYLDSAVEFEIVRKDETES